MELQDKAALLTGASRGIGRALAVELARSHCKLLLTALEEDELSSLAMELISKFSTQVTAMPADLTNPDSRQSLLDWVRAHDLSPDILINNAGGGSFSRFEATEWSNIEKTLSLNIDAFTHILHVLIPILKQRPRAKIVNISSAISRLPYPGLAAYGATKGFTASLSESLACELAESHVSVLCFNPGFTETQFMVSSGMDMSRVPAFLIKSPEKVASRIIRAIEQDRIWAYSDLPTSTFKFRF
jgi:short-subunit dehydrogenase